MAYSHYKNSKSSMSNWEPIFLNSFEVTLTPPTGIDPGQGSGGQSLLLEQVKKITGLEVDKNPGTVEQYYKFAKRRYAGARPETTTVDFTVDFEVNLNDVNSMFTFKTLRQWSDVIYNPNTGSMGLKKDYVGSALVTMFNKNGDIYRKLRFPAVWPSAPITPMELDYQSTEIYIISLQLAADYWDDSFV